MEIINMIAAMEAFTNYTKSLPPIDVALFAIGLAIAGYAIWKKGIKNMKGMLAYTSIIEAAIFSFAIAFKLI